MPESLSEADTYTLITVLSLQMREMIELLARQTLRIEGLEAKEALRSGAAERSRQLQAAAAVLNGPAPKREEMQ